MKLSDLYKLNIDDAGKAAIVTGIFTTLGTIGKSIIDITQTGHLPTGQQIGGVVGLAFLAGISYLSKNFLTPAPKSVEIDPEKTAVVNKTTKEVIVSNDNIVSNTPYIVPDLKPSNDNNIYLSMQKDIEDLKDKLAIVNRNNPYNYQPLPTTSVDKPINQAPVEESIQTITSFPTAE